MIDRPRRRWRPCENQPIPFYEYISYANLNANNVITVITVVVVRSHVPNENSKNFKTAVGYIIFTRIMISVLTLLYLLLVLTAVDSF